jgi:Protein of unknown function (DUF3631)
MSRAAPKKEVGAASTATDPIETVAACPVTLDSPNSEPPPEKISASDVAINGADLLDRLCAFYVRFVCLPTDAAVIAAILWAAHTHLMIAWDSTPRFAFLSAEPGSGKSRALEILALFALRALESANATTPSLLRAMGDPACTPTFFMDEIDTKYGPKAKGDEELRCMINAGHRRGGGFLKCEMENDVWVPVKMDSFAAVAMAGIGDLPDTILTRSIVVRMRKRAQGENVEPYRQRDHMYLGHALRDELADWAASVATKAESYRPVLPTEIVDRDADVWEPLIAVADLAGGAWPEMARKAAIEFVSNAKKGNQPSLGVELLSDIRTAFVGKDRLASAELVRLLLADPEAPWGDIHGKKLDQRKLAKLLAQYDIKSDSIRLPDHSTPKGYMMEWFNDAWKRYLPSFP